MKQVSDTQKEEVLDSTTKLPIIEEEQSMSRSRLKMHAKNNVIFLILGSIALLIFLFIFGPLLLINLSLLVGNMRDESSQVTAKEETTQSFIPKPMLSQPKKATKESKVTIEGSIQNAKSVELYVNDSLAEKKNISGSDFTFTNVPLKEGENRIKARGSNGKNKSEFSESVRVAYRQKAPEVEIETPRDGDAFSGGVSLLKVKGKTAPYAKVTINGALAITDDEGIFRYDYRMQGGENRLMIVATDDAENRSEKEVKFSYSP